VTTVETPGAAGEANGRKIRHAALPSRVVGSQKPALEPSFFDDI